MKVLTLLVCLSLTAQYSTQFRLKTNSSIAIEEEHSGAIISETESEDSVTRIDSEDHDSDKCFQCLDLHYFGHYFAKQCLPRAVDEECQPEYCPKYFDCPENPPESSESSKTEFCSFDNKKFPPESVIETGDPCRECLCKSTGNSTEISCTQSDCPPEVFENLQPDCYRKYSKGKCCPEVVCDPKFSDIKCDFEGQDYKYGDQFTPMNDPCQSCVCDEFWNSTLPVMELSCSKIKCHFEARDDCVPVYSPNACCPVDYHCPRESDGEDEPKCHFGSQTYSIGDKVHHEKQKNSSKCLECTCVVPPEVTCSLLDC